MALKEIKVSEVGSMNGWSWKQWLCSHWVDIKNAIDSPAFDSIFKPLSKYLIAWMVAHMFVDSVSAEVLLTIVGKSVFDMIDYWLSKQVI